METYNNICSVIKHRLKDKPFELEIINEPINPAIKELFEDKIQFIMYEALRTGKYTEMKLELDKIRYITTEKNRPQNIKIEVFVDLDTLYLQIKTSKSDFYKVIK